MTKSMHMVVAQTTLHILIALRAAARGRKALVGCCEGGNEPLPSEGRHLAEDIIGVAGSEVVKASKAAAAAMASPKAAARRSSFQALFAEVVIRLPFLFV